MYIQRLLKPRLDEGLRLFPAVLVTGPRQSGKTTFLLHELGSGAEYVSLDDPIERDFAVSDPNGFLDRFGGKRVILDEIQYAPGLLPHLKIRIDRDRRKNGRWVLAGSQQFHLMKNASESLAGRIAILELPPFSLIEKKGKKFPPLASVIWNGRYPEPSLDPRKRNLWVRSYIQTYIERDVRQLQSIRNMRAFEMFLKLAAAGHGQTFNTATLSREAGVSLPTIKAWAGVLEASYLCTLLPPYFRNFGKRVVKSPKLYFVDPAIVCELTRQPDGASALSGAMGGALFEGLIVSEAVKLLAATDSRADLFFWRSHDGLEVDLIVGTGAKLIPVEIKVTSTPSNRHLTPLNKFRAMAGNAGAAAGTLVCRVEKTTPLPNGNTALPWQEFPDWLLDKL